MKTITLQLFAIAATTLVLVPAFADNERFVTVTLDAGPISTNSGSYQIAGTNSIEIAEGEVGELITVHDQVQAQGSAQTAEVVKNGMTFQAFSVTGVTGTGAGPAATVRGTTVAGPATFLLTYNNSSPTPMGWRRLMTVKITPLTYSPQKTVTVAPGMGNVYVGMESSTNLVTWADATNGVYSDNLRFFRVKLTTATP